MPLFTAVFLTVGYLFGRSRGPLAAEVPAPVIGGGDATAGTAAGTATGMAAGTALLPGLAPAGPARSLPEPEGDTAPAPLRHPGIHRLLLGCGAVGPVLFVAAFLSEGALRPFYDGWYQPISALSLGPGGWVQRANFLAFGVLTACWSLGLRRALVAGPAADWVPPVQAAGAFGLVLDGIFSQDPVTGYPIDATLPLYPTVHAILHLQGSILTFTAVPLCCFMLAHRFTRTPGWRGWPTYSVVTGTVFCGLVVLFTAASADLTTLPAGVFEKLAAGTMALYGAAFSTRLLIGSGRVGPRAVSDRQHAGHIPDTGGIEAVARGTFPSGVVADLTDGTDIEDSRWIQPPRGQRR